MHICFIITRGDLIGGAQIHVRDTAVALLKDGHLFLLITHWEGFSRSIVEAMRAGLSRAGLRE